MRRPVTALCAVLALMLGACTTIPDDSTPQVVQPVGVAPPEPVTNPPVNASPHTIVDDFLAAGTNGVIDPTHTAARAYLTPAQKTHWNAAPVTVVDKTQVRNFEPAKHGRGRLGTIKVSGNEIGALDDTGAYHPSLSGNGTGFGGAEYTQTFTLKKVNGQWRIDAINPGGLVVMTDQFQSFRQYAVYFFDSNEQNLVPTAHYTQLSATNDVVPWLVQQAAAQPPAGLGTGLPQTGTNEVTVKAPADPSDPSQPIRIEVPGSSGLDRASRDRLATQLAATLQQVPQVDRLEITDGGTPVRIPAAGAAVFPVDTMSGRFQPTPPSRELFYVDRGAVLEQTGRRVPGKIGLGAYNLTSVALTTEPGTGALEVAGVRGPRDAATLDFPNPKAPGSLVATRVHGVLSRPAWAPGRHEVWIGDGNDLKRVTGPRAVQTVALNVSSGKASGRVSAVRISPDGGRVALVLTTARSSQIYVGNIVRNTNQVSVNGLAPISPQSVAVTDVAWNDQLKLFATGRDRLTGEVQGQVYEVQCDGSIWNTRGNIGLPNTPDSVTAAAGSEAVVSVGDTLWQQQGVGWQGLLDGENEGSNPVYLE